MSTKSGSILTVENALYWEKTTPDRVYMNQPVGGGKVETYTFKKTMDEARRMAAHLRSLDLPPKSHIAIISKNCAHWIIADLAIWMADHVSVPLYPTLTAETTGQILEHSDSRLAFVGKLDVWDEMKEGVPDDLPCIAFPLAPPTDCPKWGDVIEQHQPITDPATRDPDEMATIVYTSGSTGMPKGVMLSFRNMGEPCTGMWEVVHFGPDDRHLSYLPMSHVFERLVGECCTLLYGGEVFFAETLATFVQDLRRARPTLFISVPRLWLKFQQGVLAKMPAKKLNRLLKIPILKGIVKKKVLTGLGLEHVRFAGCGSAPIPAELLAWYRMLGMRLLEGYGMTENFCYSHITRPGSVKVGYVGQSFPSVECRISKEGEIQVKSPGSMIGYYKSPEATVEMFTKDGFLRTGDRGKIDDQGRLRITGRVKELFKTSKGKYVAPAPIENKILSNDLVEMACVTGAGQPQPFGLVVLAEHVRDELARKLVTRDRIEAELEAILGQTNQGLDHHERLAFLTVDDDPWTEQNGFLTPTMKLKRAVVEDRYGPLIEGWYNAKQKVVWK